MQTPWYFYHHALKKICYSFINPSYLVKIYIYALCFACCNWPIAMMRKFNNIHNKYCLDPHFVVSVDAPLKGFLRVIMRWNFSLVAYFLLLFARCSLFFTHCSLLFARCMLLFAHCSILFAGCSLLLLIARYFLLVARYFLLIACYFLFVARYFLLVASCKQNLGWFLSQHWEMLFLGGFVLKPTERA